MAMGTGRGEMSVDYYNSNLPSSSPAQSSGESVSGNWREEDGNKTEIMEK